MIFSTLADGSKIPVIGYGTAYVEKSKVKEYILVISKFHFCLPIQTRVLLHAIKVGYRHFDCAFIYANQVEVGEALKEVFASGSVKREDIWVTSKLWITDFAPDQVEKACRLSLAQLQLEYVDEYLVHWPASQVGKHVSITETWKAMEKLKQKGLVKHIGVSNFNVQLLNEIYNSAQIYKPEINQIETHPYLQQTRLVEFCRQLGVHVTAYCPVVRMGNGLTVDPLKDPILQKIASKHGKTIAQVILRWNFQRSPNVSVVPRTSTLDRITENFGSQSFQLDDADMGEIKKLECNFRINDGLEIIGTPVFD